MPTAVMRPRLPLSAFEAWAVERLMRSPFFNRTIQKMYRKLHRLPDLEPKNGGGRTGPSTFQLFKDEIKTQFRELTWQKPPPR